MGRLPNVEPDQVSRGRHPAGALARQPDAGALAQPEAGEHVREAVLADLPRGHDRADVRRLRQDPGQRVVLGAVVPGVADGAVGDPDAAGDGEHAVRGSRVPYSSAAAIVTTLFTEPGSYGLDTAALPSVASSARGEGARVERPRVGHGEHLAGLRVEHHRRTALGALRGGVLGELALHRVLQVGVQRQLQVRPGRRGPLEPGAAGDDRRAALGRVDHPQPVLARRAGCPASSPGPCSPVSLRSVAFHDATPTTFAASAPPGYCRDSRFSSAISGILARAASGATSGSTSGTSTT